VSLILGTASTTDVDALAGLAAQTFPLACPPHMPAEEIAAFIGENLSSEAFRGYLEDPECDVVTARTEIGAEPAGYALAFSQVAPPEIAELIGAGPVCYLSKLYVRPGVIGSGVGYALFGRVRELAVARGLSTLWLGTNQRNTRSQGFYDRNGFERVGTRQFLVGGILEDDFVYALKL
jgi:ribosomal protein S18 acetylase RimI-like enzyme